MEIIIRESSSERRERLSRSRRDPNLRDKVGAIARNAEEAAELDHRRRNEEDAKPIMVEGGPERYQAFADDMQRIGQDPERVDAQWHPEHHRKKTRGRRIF